MKIKFLLVLIVPLISNAQGVKVEKKNVSSTVSNKPSSQVQKPPFKSSFNIQAMAGSQGIGLDLKLGISPKSSLRLGSSFMSIKRNNFFEIDGFDTENNLDANFNNIHFLMDYAPFKTNKFQLVFGAGYLYQPKANVLLMPNSKNPYTVGNYQLNANEIGELSMGVKWKSFAPYFGLGFFQPFPKKKFNVNLDLGTYFLGSPKTTVTGTKMLQNNAAMEPILNENLKGYKFLPVIQMNFNYKIK